MTTPRPFDTTALPDEPSGLAPDGSAVRLLCTLAGGSMAHFTLDPGAVSVAVAHRTVEEIWYILSGEGEMWRRQDEREEVSVLRAGISLTLPLGTHFQFRNTGSDPLTFVLVTMPPWPGPDEAFEVEGRWSTG